MAKSRKGTFVGLANRDYRTFPRFYRIELMPDAERELLRKP
jgi:hypothetical protein